MQVAIITGGTRGLGLATAQALGQAGWHVLLTYRSDQAVAERAVEALSALGASAESLLLDASAPGAAKVLSEHARVASATRLNVVHNAAPAFAPTPLHLLGWEHFDAQLSVGLRGLVSLAQATVPRMAKTGGGVIAVVLSRAVLGEPPKGFGAYVAAKQAMRSLVKSLAVEHRARGVRTFSACPGFMPTALTADWNPSLRAAAELAAETNVDSGGREIARLLSAAGAHEIPGLGEDYLV